MVINGYKQNTCSVLVYNQAYLNLTLRGGLHKKKFFMLSIQ